MSKDKNKKSEEVFEEENLVENENSTDNKEQTEKKSEEKKEELSETEILEEKLAKEKDRYLRLFAEFENYKRRTSKERIEMFKTAGREVMEALLPVLDDFERALNEMKKSADKELLEGVELINDKLIKSLNNQGLEVMAVKAGDKFDADLHEAVTQIPAPKKKLKGKVVDVIQKGYTLGEKIIRYPKVVTGA